MSLTETRYEHIVIDDRGVARALGTTENPTTLMKVIELVMTHQAKGVDAEGLQRAYPYMTLGQIHSALAYYYDHREEVDREIEEDIAAVEEIMERIPQNPAVERLRALHAD